MHTITSLWPSSATSCPTKSRRLLCQQDICVCPQLWPWFLISFKIIMHPSWIGLLLAAVRFSSGQISKSVVFREWFLSFPHNYTLFWLMSWSALLPPSRGKASLFPLYLFSQGPEGRGEWHGEGGLGLSPHKCSGIIQQSQSRRVIPSSPWKLPTLVNTIWGTENTWHETSCYSWMLTDCPPTPQCPLAQVYFSQAWSPNHTHPWSPLKVHP